MDRAAKTWREWLAEYQAAEPWHGTAGGYSNHGCRCEQCSAAMRDAQRARKNRRRGTEPPRHGTTNGYFNYGCRCGDCRAACAENMRLRRAKAAARQ